MSKAKGGTNFDQTLAKQKRKKKRTSIGDSPNSKPKHKSKRRS